MADLEKCQESNFYLRSWLERGEKEDEVESIFKDAHIRKRFRDPKLHKYTPSAPSTSTAEKTDPMPANVKTFCEEVAQILVIDEESAKQLVDRYLNAGLYTEFSVAHHQGSKYDLLQIEGINTIDNPVIGELRNMLQSERENLINCIACVARYALDGDHPFYKPCQRIAKRWCQDEELLDRLWDGFEELDKDSLWRSEPIEGNPAARLSELGNAMTISSALAYARPIGNLASVPDRLELQILFLEAMILLTADAEISGPPSVTRFVKMLEIFHAQKFLGSLFRFNANVNQLLSQEREATFPMWDLCQRVGDLCVLVLIQTFVLCDFEQLENHPLFASDTMCTSVHTIFVEWATEIGRRGHHHPTQVKHDVGVMMDLHCRSQMSIVVVAWLAILSANPRICEKFRLDPTQLMGKTIKDTPLIAEAIEGLVSRGFFTSKSDSMQNDNWVLRFIGKHFVGLVSSVLNVSAFPQLPKALSRLLHASLSVSRVDGSSGDDLCAEFWKQDYAPRTGCFTLFQDLFGDRTTNFTNFVELMSGMVGGNKERDDVYQSFMTILCNPLHNIQVTKAEAADCIYERRDGILELRQNIYAEELFLRGSDASLCHGWLSEATILPQDLQGITLEQGATPSSMQNYLVPLPPHSKLTLMRMIGFAWDATLHQGFSGKYLSIRKTSRELLVAIVRLITAMLINHPERWMEIEGFFPGQYFFVDRLLASFFLMAPHASATGGLELRQEVCSILRALQCVGPNSGGYWMVLNCLDRPRDLQCRLPLGSAKDFIQCLWDLEGMEKSQSNYSCTIAALGFIRHLFEVCPLVLWQLKWPYHAALSGNQEVDTRKIAVNELRDNALHDISQVRVLDEVLRFVFSIFANHLLWPATHPVERWALSKETISILSLALDAFRVFNWPNVEESCEHYDFNSGSAVLKSSMPGIKVVQQNVLQHISEAGLVPSLMQFLYCDMVEKGKDGSFIGFQNTLLRAHILDCKKAKEGDAKVEALQPHGYGWINLLLEDALECFDKLLSICREPQLSPYVASLATHLLEQTTLPGPSSKATLPVQSSKQGLGADTAHADFIKSLYAYVCQPDAELAKKGAKVLTETLVFWSHQKSSTYLSSFLSHGPKADGFFSSFLVEHIISQIASSTDVGLRIALCDLLTVGAELHPSVFCPSVEKIVDTCNTVIEEKVALFRDKTEAAKHWGGQNVELLRALVHVLLAFARQSKTNLLQNEKGSYKWGLLQKLCTDVLTPRLRRPVDKHGSETNHLVLLARAVVHLATVAIDVPLLKDKKKDPELLALVKTLCAQCKWFSVPDANSRSGGFFLGALRSVAVLSFFLPSREDGKSVDYFRGFLVKYQLQLNALVYHREGTDLRQDLYDIATGDADHNYPGNASIDVAFSHLKDEIAKAKAINGAAYVSAADASRLYGEKIRRQDGASPNAVPAWILRSLPSSSMATYGPNFYSSQPTVRCVTSLLKAATMATKQDVPDDLDDLPACLQDLSWRKSFWDAAEMFLESYEYLIVSTLTYALRMDGLTTNNEDGSGSLAIKSSFSPSKAAAQFLEQSIAPLLSHIVPFLHQLLELHDRVVDHPRLFSLLLRLVTRLVVFPPFLDPVYAPPLTVCPGQLPSGSPVKPPEEARALLRVLYSESDASVHLFRHLTLCFQASARGITTAATATSRGASTYVGVCINVSSLLLTLLPSVTKSTRGFEVVPILLELINTVTNLLKLHVTRRGYTTVATTNKSSISSLPPPRQQTGGAAVGGGLGGGGGGPSHQKRTVTAFEKENENAGPTGTGAGTCRSAPMEGITPQQAPEPKRLKEAGSVIIDDEGTNACGFLSVLCTIGAGALEALQEREGFFAGVEKLSGAVLNSSRVLFSPGWTASSEVIEELLSNAPPTHALGFTLMLSWCRRLDSVLHLLQGLAATTHGATLLIESGIFLHLQNSQLLRWAALPMSKNNSDAGAYPSAYITPICDNKPHMWRRPLHTTWCHSLLLVEKLLQQTPVAAQQPALDFIEVFEGRFTYLLERGVHGGDMAMHEECSVASKILGLLPRHSPLTRKLLFAVAKGYSLVMSSITGPSDVIRPKTQLEKLSANVVVVDDAPSSTQVPSVFHQRTQYLAFDTFRSNCRGLLHLALSTEQDKVRADDPGWSAVMDHVLEGGRRVFEFLNELTYRKHALFIRFRQDERTRLSLTDSDMNDVLPLSMYLLAQAPDEPAEKSSKDAPPSPAWSPMPEQFEGATTYSRMTVMPLLFSGGQALGVAPETTTLEEFAHLCGVTLEMVGGLLFHFCTNGGNSSGVLHGFLNFLHELRSSALYQGYLLESTTKTFFDSIDETLRSSLNLGTGDAMQAEQGMEA